MTVAGRRGDGPGQVGPAEAEDEVRGPDQPGGRGRQEHARRIRLQRVPGREDRAVLEVGDHQRPVPFGQGDPAVPVLLIAPEAAKQEERTARFAEKLQRGLDRDGIGPVRPRRPVPAGIGNHRRRCQRLLLQAHVEADVGRRGRRLPGDRVRASQRVQGRLDGGGLVIPLGVVPDQRALVGRGVDPVDPGPPPGRVHGAGRPDDQHRDAVAVGVVDGHARVHQAHVAVYRDGQRTPGHLRVAMGDRDRVLLVQADEQLRITVAVVVHQAVVQSPVARAGDERDVPQVETAQQLRQRIAAPLDRDFAALDALGVFRPHVAPPAYAADGTREYVTGARHPAPGFCGQPPGAQAASGLRRQEEVYLLTADGGGQTATAGRRGQTGPHAPWPWWPGPSPACATPATALATSPAATRRQPAELREVRAAPRLTR